MTSTLSNEYRCDKKNMSTSLIGSTYIDKNPKTHKENANRTISEVKSDISQRYYS